MLKVRAVRSDHVSTWSGIVTNGTHHPCVTPASVHKPSRDLTSSLDDEQTTKALGQLKEWR